MKYIKEISFFKNEELEKGDKIVLRLLEIIKDEKIEIDHSGGYQIELDDKIYSFADFRVSILNHDCRVSIFNKNQKIMKGQYAGVVAGVPSSRYKFSYKLWKELEKLYNQQQTPINNDLEELSDLNRTAKKYNL